MKIKEEIRTQAEEIERLAGLLDALVVDIDAQDAKRFDEVAREIIGHAESIKDLAYRLGRGEDRVTKIEVRS